MNPFLRVTRYPYEEPYHLNLVVTASNGRVQGGLEIYCNAEDLGVVARGLRTFPFSESRDAVLWELGSESPEDRFGFYFRLRLIRISALGRCAIEMRTNNNSAPPEREITEFSIEALAADLDRLADLLDGFSKLEHKVLYWDLQDGELLS